MHAMPNLQSRFLLALHIRQEIVSLSLQLLSNLAASLLKTNTGQGLKGKKVDISPMGFFNLQVIDESAEKHCIRLWPMPSSPCWSRHPCACKQTFRSNVEDIKQWPLSLSNDRVELEDSDSVGPWVVTYLTTAKIVTLLE